MRLTVLFLATVNCKLNSVEIVWQISYPPANGGSLGRWLKKKFFFFGGGGGKVRTSKIYQPGSTHDFFVLLDIFL